MWVLGSAGSAAFGASGGEGAGSGGAASGGFGGAISTAAVRSGGVRGLAGAASRVAVGPNIFTSAPHGWTKIRRTAMPSRSENSKERVFIEIPSGYWLAHTMRAIQSIRSTGNTRLGWSGLKEASSTVFA